MGRRAAAPSRSDAGNTTGTAVRYAPVCRCGASRWPGTGGAAAPVPPATPLPIQNEGVCHAAPL